MKNLLTSLLAFMLTANAYCQQPTFITTQNDQIKMTLNNSVITVENLTSNKIKVALINTVEDTISLNKHQTKVVHELTGKQYIRAVIVGNTCGQSDCGLILQTDCTLLPVIVSNFSAKRIDNNTVQLQFDAYNTGHDDNYFIASYSLDNGITWHTIKLDLPEITGLQTHFIKNIKIN